MRKFVVATDSNSCLNYLNEEDTHDIEVVPLYLFIKGERKLDTIDIDSDSFIHWMRQNPKEIPYVTPPSAQDIEQLVLKWIDEGHSEALFVTMSSSICNIHTIVEKIANKYKAKINIATFDSKGHSFQQVMLLQEGKRLLKKGLPLSTILTRLEFMRNRSDIFFTICDFDYLVRTQKLRPHYKITSKILKIYPVLTFDKNGSINKVTQQKGLEKTLERCISHCEKFISDQKAHIFVIHNGDSKGHSFEKAVKSYFKDKKVTKLPATPAIACNIGPNVYGVGAFVTA